MDVYKSQPGMPPTGVTYLPAPPSGDEQSNYLDLITVLRRHFTVVLACIVLITVISATIVFQLVPKYTAEASVILDPRKTPQVLDMQAVLSGLPADTEVVQGEAQVLKSNSLAEEVVKRTNLIAVPEFNARLRSDSFSTALLGPFYWIESSIKSLIAP